MAKRRRSRLQRKEEKRNIRQAVVLSILTLGIAVGLIFLGIPILIRAAIFLGEIRSSSEPIQSQDNLPPMPPRFDTPTEATNEQSISLSGYSEPGAEIEILINDQSAVKVVCENDGTFLANNLNLNQGVNEIFARATDQAGNKSQNSKTIEVVYDNEAPELEITDPTDQSEYYGNDRQVKITGKTEPKASVSINERIVIVNFEGNFEYTYQLNEGENAIKVLAKDRAGNETEKSLNLTYSP